MTNLLDKTLEKIQQPLQYAAVSRRTFLKGALAVGGALALAGCKKDPVDPATTSSVATTQPPSTPTTRTTTATPPIPDTTVTSTSQPPTVTPPPVTPVTGPPRSDWVTPIVDRPSYIIPEAQFCIGCRKCSIACSMFHHGTPDMYLSNIVVHSMTIGEGMVDIPILCVKCNDTPCITSCPPAIAALSVNESTGAIIVDNTKCIGCNNCVVVCAADRTGTLRLSRDGRSLAGLCDLCGGDPSCVKVCSEGCIEVTPKNVQGQYWACNAEVLSKRIAYLLYGVPYTEIFEPLELNGTSL